jgi:aerobic carbon-monoxide dehydrogenase medium subunit
VAAGAKAVVQGPKGKRSVPVEQIPVGPGRTSLKKGELVESLVLPARKPKLGRCLSALHPALRNGHRGGERRREPDARRQGRVTAARVALGAVAPTVLLVAAAAKAIIGTKLDDAALEKLGQAASAACRPIDDKRGTIEFRTKVAAVLAKRAAKIAYTRAGGK